MAVPAVSSFAQGQPLTRAEVTADPVQVERAGYNPSIDRATYTAAIEAAEAKVSSGNGQTGYGGDAETSSASIGLAHTGNSVTPVTSIIDPRREPTASLTV
ncbi:DUF4148 domain-containing protein [Caballeronia fortuita]|uniref:DUF4148 domain-containing protein n=1 Tax=Caballeronia fortuita TaxID=1777138 RepID=UPI0007726D4A|nr:DUF4148 domain-containing protein [Caballeronia fortuita]